MKLLRTFLDHPAALVMAVLLGWGLSEYAMVMTGKHLSWEMGMACNCLGVVTVNLYTMRNESLDIFKSDRSVIYAVLTGVFYAVADIYFLKLSGNTRLHHLADVSVLAPLCALYVLIPTALGVLIDREPVTTRKVVGVGMAVVAIFLLGHDDDDRR